MTLDYDDIQGTILRGYRVDLARHFVLSVADRGRARNFMASLITPSSGMPQITTAARWNVKPPSFLNIGITANGLEALGHALEHPLDDAPSFSHGATDTTIAEKVGDVGDSAPSKWINGLSDGMKVHLILSLWVTADHDELERVSALLRDAFARFSLTELGVQDATALPDNKIHFGYTDNISQPRVDGAPPPKLPLPDMQSTAPTGEFLLGYPNQFNAPKAGFRVTPDQLSKNSSFGVFRLLEQDVAGFESWLQREAPTVDLDVEALAAKVCGRWRNGMPLVLCPDTPDSPVVAPDQINNYTYLSSDNDRDDTFGYKCPIGAHMRRSNPRNEAVRGAPDEGSKHRITRRAMPYGPAYDPNEPADTTRGLVGWFINASIEQGFEFVMRAWVNNPSGENFVASRPGPHRADPRSNISGRDVLLGANDPTISSFIIPEPPADADDPRSRAKHKKLTGFRSFVTTRGGAYCLLPSIHALRYISGAG